MPILKGRTLFRDDFKYITQKANLTKISNKAGVVENRADRSQKKKQKKSQVMSEKTVQSNLFNGSPDNGSNLLITRIWLVSSYNAPLIRHFGIIVQSGY